METTIAREGTYRPVGFGGAFLQQFRLLWMSRRPLLLMVAFLGLLALAGEPWSESSLARLLTLWPLWLMLVGPFWAFAVWHQEGPSNRLYFWSQPVSRTGQSLARVAAGAAWLWVLYALLILAAFVFAAFDGDAGQLAEVGLPGWVSLFASPLIGYLIISVLAVPSDYPIRWFLGFLFGVPITISLLDEWVGLEDVVRTILTPLVDERWGLGVTLIAPFLIEISELQHLINGGGSGMVNQDTDFSLRLWWVIMPLWIAFWAGLTALFAARHPDEFPRWRRGA